MFKPKQDFTMRPTAAELPKVGPIISTDWLVDIVDDAGNGWVAAEAYGRREQDFAKGFAKREWLHEAAFDKEIQVGKFFVACIDGAHDFKTNAAYLLAVAQIESGLKNIPAANSSAFGPFQILADTWAQYMVDPKIRLTKRHRYDPYLQPIVAAKIAADGTAALAQILPGNVNPTPPELYFSHLFGVAGAKLILDSETRKGNIQQALEKVYAQDPAPAERAKKIIAANKGRLAPNGQPLPVEEILKAVGEDLKKALEEAVPDDVAAAASGDLQKEFVAMVQAGDTTYWVFDNFNEDVGGQQLVRQVRDAVPEVLASDTKLMPLKRGIVPDDVTDKLNKAAEETPAQDGPAGPPLPAGADPGPPMLAAAKAANRTLDTSTVPNTNNGTLACAWAVNEIARQAIGRPIGGGLSTVGLFEALKSHSPVQENQLSGGCIVISPTQPGRTGHVGIVGDILPNLNATKIYSNSSSKRLFCDNYTIASWKSYFEGRGLPVRFFKLV